ncbi:MAG: c-type cytochrome [Acidimicrobiia bacterium]
MSGESATAQQDDGATAYQQACASCHQADGAGIPGAFPPLAGNPNVADPDYVADVIRNGVQGPISVNGETYDGVMPAITGLTDTQIEAVAAYVAGMATGVAGTPPTPTTAPAGPVPGDAQHGDDLFVGREALAAGGASCAGCHAAGAFGGASLGPDLTDAFTRLGGEAGLSGWLATPPSATMQPLYTQHPLEETEIADLVAFLASIDGTVPDRGPDVMLWGGLIGLGVLFGAMTLVFKRPRGRYIDHLRSRA